MNKDKFKVLFRRLAARYFYPIISLIIRMKFAAKKLTNPIIILTPGKVGSTSIEKTLLSIGLKDVYHIHNFNEKTIESSKITHKKSERKSIPLHLIVATYLKKKIDSFQGNVFYITVVREPIARNISSFLQNIDQQKKLYENSDLSLKIDDCVKYLNRTNNLTIIDDLNHWYRTEIEQNLGINLYDYTYDYNLDYQIISKPRRKLLVLRMETMNQTFPKALKEFLELNSEVKLKNSNVGDDKYYSDDYKILKNEVSISEEVLDGIINSNYFDHFYSDLIHNTKNKYLK